MKILRLELRAFGPFEGDALDFPDPGPGLHLIHGPNEAGKSSALRALGDLLFGFPPRTTDNHRHDYKDLRVGATLLGPNGERLAFVRRKALGKSLRAEDDETILADDALIPFLGVVDRDRFNRIAMSNLADLVEGGRSIVEGKGDLGDILFGASGLAKLPQIRRELESDADLLFKKSAKIPKINATLLEIEAARKLSREKMLSTDEWRRADGDLKAAHASLDDLDIALAREEAEHRRLDRLSRALPLLAARSDAQMRLDAMGDIPILPEGFAERRLNAQAERSTAVESAGAAGREIAGIEAELEMIEVPDLILAEAPAIASLREELGGLRKARTRRPRLAEQAAQAESAATAFLRDLDPDRTLADAENLRLSKARQKAIQTLEREYVTLEAEIAKARETVRAHALSVTEAPIETGPDARRKLDDLASLVKRLQARGDLEGFRQAASAEVRRLEAEGTVELARLPGWSGSLDDLASSPIPTDGTIAGLETDLASAEASLKAILNAIQSNADDVRNLESQAEQARAGGDPPRQADLEQARTDREEGWRLIRRGWIEGVADNPPSELALKYEHLVASADFLADALRREADRVAVIAQLDARRRRLAESGEGLKSQRAEAEAALARARAAWSDAWTSAGVKAGNPIEMRDWLVRYHALLTHSGSIRSARQAELGATAALCLARSEIDSALQTLSMPPADPTTGLATLMDRARLAIERGNLARNLESARASLAEAESRREAWRARWADAVRPLGLGPDATPELARDTLERLGGLFDKLEEARRKRAEVDEIDAEAERFAHEVDELARRVGRAAGEGPPEAVADALVACLDEARRETIRRDSAHSRLEIEQKRLDAAEAAIRDRNSLLEALRSEARCPTIDDLPVAERASDEARAIRDRLERLEADLLALGGGASVADLALDAEGLDPDMLPTQIRSLADRVEAHRANRDKLNQQVGKLQAELDAMDGRSEAGAADEDARRWVAALEDHVAEYVRLRLASAALRRAIERYREEHQGPILRRLGDLFAELTAGSFAGVIVDDETEPGGRPVLRGLRPDPKAKPIPVEGMSEGTADALYLAVRLATLETYLDGHAPLPFVIDDILVHFDDARAGAALRALGRLAERTQVLFFTHHEHIVDLASEVLDAQTWRLHRLPGRVSSRA
jgi:uncharacterized protein YhaN